MTYRAEIDGLRAIAVVSVILYHAELVISGRDWFEGGFIGVDIFFVISGYLISRIILTELSETNNFNFIKFYERRARRILPVLLLVIATCIPFAFLRLPPMDLVSFSSSAVSAIGFVSNFYFYHSVTEYGTGPALLKPLLHTWSLGVEEQFYIVAPIMLLLMWRRTHSSLLTLLFTVMLLSIQFAEITQARNSQLNFFLPFSRFWELIVGSILAFSEFRYGKFKHTITTQIFPVVGLFLIFHGIFFFNADTPHPSFHTLIPVSGVVLIIAFCSTDDLVGKILSWKPVVGVGLVSYSLYLWHFPIFAFNRIGAASPTNFDKVEWIGLAITLSIISYFFVEQPFRRSLSSRFFLWTIPPFTLVIVACLTFFIYEKGLISLKNEASAGGANKTYFELFTASAWEVRDENDVLCSNKEISTACKFSSKKNSIDVVVVGDSIAASLGNGFYQKRSEINLTLLTRSACYFFPNTDFYQRNPSHPCDSDYQNERFGYLRTLEDSTIVFAGMVDQYIAQNANTPVGGRSAKELFTSSIYQLLQKNNKIVLVYPMPIPRKSVKKAIHDSMNSNGRHVLLSIREYLSKDLSVEVDEFLKRSKLGFELLDSIEHPNVIRVYPHKNICDGVCEFTTESSVYVLDKHHYSAEFARLVAAQILEKRSINED